jgi:hypothetical protein
MPLSTQNLSSYHNGPITLAGLDRHGRHRLLQSARFDKAISLYLFLDLLNNLFDLLFAFFYRLIDFLAGALCRALLTTG